MQNLTRVLSVGDKVYHYLYGEGTVSRVSHLDECLPIHVKYLHRDAHQNLLYTKYGQDLGFTQRVLSSEPWPEPASFPEPEPVWRTIEYGTPNINEEVLVSEHARVSMRRVFLGTFSGYMLFKHNFGGDVKSFKYWKPIH